MGMIWVGYRRDASTARALLEDPEGLGELLESDDEETSVDLDKAWHALHWLLNDAGDVSAQRAPEAIFGGEEVGEDLGYGPGRLLTPDRVQAVARTLAELEVETLRARMNPSAMEAAEVYPRIWDEEDVYDDYLVPAFERLRVFYSAAASADEAVIQTIC